MREDGGHRYFKSGEQGLLKLLTCPGMRAPPPEALHLTYYGVATVCWQGLGREPASWLRVFTKTSKNLSSQPPSQRGATLDVGRALGVPALLPAISGNPGGHLVNGYQRHKRQGGA